MFRGERYIVPGIAASLAIALGGAACGGSKKSANCLSPRQASLDYPGDRAAFSDNPLNWPDGVVAATNVPAAATGVVAEFEKPNSGKWHESQPVTGDKAGAILLRIGPGAVKFAVRLQATAGSALCHQAPEATFEGPGPVHQLATEYGPVATANGWHAENSSH